MRSIVIPSFAAVLFMAGGALAQSDNGYSGAAAGQHTAQANQQSESQANSQDQRLTASKLKQDLQDAGFTDIQILEESFVVQAKDKNGNPTIMTLSPNGFVAFEAMNGQNRRARSTTGGNQAQPQTR